MSLTDHRAWITFAFHSGYKCLLIRRVATEGSVLVNYNLRKIVNDPYKGTTQL